MAVLGVPLHAMVQNLGQANDGYRTVGGTNKVLSQGFTTGIGRVPAAGHRRQRRRLRQ